MITLPEVEQVFRARIRESIEAKEALLDDLGPCVAVAELLIEAYRHGGGMLILATAAVRPMPSTSPRSSWVSSIAVAPRSGRSR